MEPFRFHVFVCDQQKPESVPCCSARRSAKVIDTLRQEILNRGLGDTVQITTCGSLGLCEHGPNMIVYPEGTWYSGLTRQTCLRSSNPTFRTGRPSSGSPGPTLTESAPRSSPTAI